MENSPLKSLIQSGTKLWVDSVDPDLIQRDLKNGATGATSNPIIITDLISSGRFDAEIERLKATGLGASSVAWALTDSIVSEAEEQFKNIWAATGGQDGYVSFELDPLIEDDETLTLEGKVAAYVELGKDWSVGHPNRLIKIPATEAGLLSIEPLVADGVNLNVTLIFTERQCDLARQAIWAGAQRRGNVDNLKCVLSVFVSRVDAYTRTTCTKLEADLQGSVGILNAQHIYLMNREFWKTRKTRLSQEMVFASTGTKYPEDSPDKYVRALAGGDIQTNPPATNAWVSENAHEPFNARLEMVKSERIQRMFTQVDMQLLENVLMTEGVAKFVEPQRKLLTLLSEKIG